MTNEGMVNTITSLVDRLVVVAKDQIWRDLEGEVVILNAKSGIYCGLNEVGSRVWALIQAPTSVRHVRDILLEEYDVETDQCESDLLTLLEDMASHGLIEVLSEADI